MFRQLFELSLTWPPALKLILLIFFTSIMISMTALGFVYLMELLG